MIEPLPRTALAFSEWARPLWPISFPVAGLAAWQVGRILLRKRCFVKRERHRHITRIDSAIRVLSHSPGHNACASLVWSESDLLSLIATHHLWGDADMRALRGLLAVAMNVPLRNAKRGVFTEKPRKFIDSMPDTTARAILNSVADVLSDERARRARGLWGIIAYNQFTYAPNPSERREGEQPARRTEFEVRHPKLVANLPQRAELSHEIKGWQPQKEPGCSAMAQFRAKEKEWNDSRFWGRVFDREDLDPAVAFVKALLSFIAHMTRSRPMYVSDIEFDEFVEPRYNKCIQGALRALVDILDYAETASDAPPLVKCGAACQDLSEAMEGLYRLFGHEFAELAGCIPPREKPSLRDRVGALLSPTHHGRWLRVGARRCRGRRTSEDEAIPPVEITQNEFSRKCNLLSADKGREQDQSQFLQTGFWNTFELFNKGSISLIAKVLCAIEKSTGLHRVDRIVGIAWGGLPLATLISMGLTFPSGRIPLTVLSLYPYLRIQPKTRRRRRCLMVDASLHSGFTARSLAGRMGLYMKQAPPRVVDYLFGLMPRMNRFPDGEPEFLHVKRAKSLATCADPGEFDKSDWQDPPVLSDSDVLAAVTPEEIRRYVLHLRREFHTDVEKLRSDSYGEQNGLFREVREDKDSRFLASVYVDAEAPEAGQEDRKVKTFTIEGFFDDPDLAKEASKCFYGYLVAQKLLDPNEDNDLLVIAGSRNVVPFATCVALFDMAGRDDGGGRVRLSCARRMGERLLYCGDNVLESAGKVLILDMMIKDGGVAESICENLAERFALLAKHDVELGLLALAGASDGINSLDRCLRAKGVFKPLFKEEDRELFVKAFPTVAFVRRQEKT